VLVNARTEIVALAKLHDTHPDGCTGVVVLAERTEEGKLIHAQNWDWLAECLETAVVLRIKREDGPDILTFTEAGGLARSGLNAAGIAITANYLESDRDYRQSGIPLPLIRRKVLEQEHLALAMKTVVTSPKACSNNMLLSSAEGFAIDFECAPDECFPLYPTGEMLVHANHWQSPVALSKLKDTGIDDVPESFYRDWRARRLLERKRAITLEDVKQALFDGFGRPFAVCRPPSEPDFGNLSATVAMIVMEPGSGFMDIAPMPALNRLFTRYRLEGEPQTLN
jgi:isopenicillin-N N-acyltransferase-like protein